jgi:uncharacterized protein YndB with AHSA1/START domain
MAGSPKCVRAEVEIDAPIERVWRILTDLEGYAAWNPFTPRVESTLRIGDPVHLHVRLVGARLMHRVETVTRNEPYTLGWDMQMGGGVLLYAERVQVLTALDENRTHYMTEDCFRGWLRPLVLALFGGGMQRGFRDCGLGLKKAAESAAREEERA